MIDQRCVRRVALPTQLEGEFVELLMLQWRTEPATQKRYRPTADEVTLKRRVLSRLNSVPPLGSGPRFIVAPELSLPVELIPTVETYLASQTETTVFMAGLQSLNPRELGAVVKSGFYIGDEPNASPRLVNAAAIWIHHLGRTDRYLQVKRNLADPELSSYSSGTNLFVFQSLCAGCACDAPLQCNNARPLTFAVAICADFTRRKSISDLREAIAHHSPTLDLTFVLQMNGNQTHEVIAEGIAKYFAPPVAGRSSALTTTSLLVYLNNAFAPEDKNTYGSCVFFPESVVRTAATPSPTYIFKPGGRFNSALLRDRGPCAYRLHVRLPRYRTPGGGQGEAPIKTAEHSSLDEQFAFKELMPRRFWFRKACTLAGAKLPTLQNFLGSSPQSHNGLIEAFRAAYQQLTDWLHDAFATYDFSVLEFMRLFRLGRDLEDIEPSEWKLDAAAGALLRCLTILTLAQKKEGQLADCVRSHITIGGTHLTLLHADDRSWRVLMDAYHDLVDATFGNQRVSVAFVQPTETALPSVATAWIPSEVDRAIVQQDEFTAPSACSYTVLPITTLFDKYYEALDLDAAITELTRLIDPAFESVSKTA
jgi:hypothetical protein